MKNYRCLNCGAEYDNLPFECDTPGCGNNNPAFFEFIGSAEPIAEPPLALENDTFAEEAKRAEEARQRAEEAKRAEEARRAAKNAPNKKKNKNKKTVLIIVTVLIVAAALGAAATILIPMFTNKGQDRNRSTTDPTTPAPTTDPTTPASTAETTTVPKTTEAPPSELNIRLVFFQYFADDPQSTVLTDVLYTDALDSGIFLIVDDEEALEELKDLKNCVLYVSKGDNTTVKKSLTINSNVKTNSYYDIYESSDFKKSFGESGYVTAYLTDDDGNVLSDVATVKIEERQSATTQPATKGKYKTLTAYKKGDSDFHSDFSVKVLNEKWSVYRTVYDYSITFDVYSDLEEKLLKIALDKKESELDQDTNRMYEKIAENCDIASDKLKIVYNFYDDKKNLYDTWTFTLKN